MEKGGDKPRPLLVGMRTTDDKEVLLDNAKYLKDTHLSSVGIRRYGRRRRWRRRPRGGTRT